MGDGFALRGFVKLDRSRHATIDALDLADYGLLVKLVRYVDSRTRRYHCTQAELAEWVGLDRKNLRKRLQRLEGLGLVKVDFPRGHKGTVDVLCYDAVVTSPQGAIRPIRKGRGHPIRVEPYEGAVRGDLPPHKGRSVPCDQEPLSTLSTGDVAVDRSLPNKQPPPPPPSQTREEEEVVVKDAHDFDPFVGQEGQGRDGGSEVADGFQANLVRLALDELAPDKLPDWWEDGMLRDLTAAQARRFVDHVGFNGMTPSEYASRRSLRRRVRAVRP